MISVMLVTMDTPTVQVSSCYISVDFFFCFLGVVLTVRIGNYFFFYRGDEVKRRQNSLIILPGCDCDVANSFGESCDQENGQCNCEHNFK